MTTSAESTPQRPGQAGSSQTVRVRNVALPTEHGGWGFLIEPILLGRLVAPTAAGLLLAVATVAAFLLRQPLKMLLIDHRRAVQTPRTTFALRFLLLYTLLAVGGLFGAWWLAGPDFLLVLTLALPAAAVFVYYDLTRTGRTPQAEIAAPIALAVVSAAMAIMAGWSWPAALALWTMLVARAVPAVFYVRSRIRLDKGRATNVYVPNLLHLIALAIVVWLIVDNLLPPITAVVFMLLFMRSMILLAPRRPQMSIKRIGIMELALGLLSVLVIAVGFWQA